MNRGVRASSPIAARRSLTSPVSVVSDTKVLGQRTRWRSSFAIASGLSGSGPRAAETPSAGRGPDGPRARARGSASRRRSHRIGRAFLSTEKPPIAHGSATTARALRSERDYRPKRPSGRCEGGTEPGMLPHSPRASRSGLVALAALLVGGSISRAQEGPGAEPREHRHCIPPGFIPSSQWRSAKPTAVWENSWLPAAVFRVRRRLGVSSLQDRNSTSSARRGRATWEWIWFVDAGSARTLCGVRRLCLHEPRQPGRPFLRRPLHTCDQPKGNRIPGDGRSSTRSSTRSAWARTRRRATEITRRVEFRCGS